MAVFSACVKIVKNGNKNFKPSLKDAKEHWDRYTREEIRFFYYLDKNTNLAKYAIAVYPRMLYVNKLIGENYISEANFEIYNAEDRLDYDVFDKLPTDNLGVELICNIKLSMQNNIIYIVENSIKTKLAEIKDDTLYIEEDVKEIGILKNILSREKLNKIKSIIIPNSIKEIGDETFAYCFSIESITIPNSVKKIEDSAFYNCTSLKSITIPNSVEKIGWYTFESCLSLESVIIPDSVEEIGYGAFYNCKSLKSIIIPNSVEIIRDFTFSYCPNLTIYCEAESQPDGWDKKWNPGNRPVVWGYKDNRVSEDLDDNALDTNLDTNSIISLLSNTFGTTDEPEATAMYILPNGRFLFTTPLEPSDDCDYEIEEHRNIDDFLYHKGNFIRFNIVDEYYGYYSYIQLNKKQPTSQQYNALLKIFDYVINNKYEYLSIIFDSQYGKQIKLELNNYTSDELLKKIKRYYVSGILIENKNNSGILFKTVVHDEAMKDLKTIFDNNPNILDFLNTSRIKLENTGIDFYKLKIVENEGRYKIPNTNKNIQFYALKNASLQIRCYFFLENNIFYIGRIVKKDYQKLNKKDLEIAYWRFKKDSVK